MSCGTSVETYLGLTAGEFKDRFYKHDRDFRDPGQKNSSTISLHLETEGRTEDLQYKKGYSDESYAILGSVQEV